MDVNKLSIEALTGCFVAALIGQILKYLYTTHQLPFLGFLFCRLLVLGIAIALLSYLKRQQDFGETLLISSLVFVGLMA